MTSQEKAIFLQLHGWITTTPPWRGWPGFIWCLPKEGGGRQDFDGADIFTLDEAFMVQTAVIEYGDNEYLWPSDILTSLRKAEEKHEV